MKLGSGRSSSPMPLDLQPVHVGDVIARVQRPMTATADAQTIVYADPAVLCGILEHLVDNTATPAELAVIAEPTAVLFRISDRGPGIPTLEREGVLDANVRAAVEAFGGRLWIEDNAPRGAVFCFLLPTGN
jgi:K+-sensing histidine kinase KdpD